MIFETPLGDVISRDPAEEYRAGPGGLEGLEEAVIGLSTASVTCLDRLAKEILL